MIYQILSPRQYPSDDKHKPQQRDKMNPSDIAKHVSMEEPGEWLEEFDGLRHGAIGSLWQRYLSGEYVPAKDSNSRSQVRLVHSDDLKIHAHLDEVTEALKDIQVRDARSADRKGTNFMGYNEEQHCVVFRGEARHLEHFLTFAYGIVKREHVEHAIKANSDVCFPEEGIEPGLGYDEFASRVEIIEYAMWLKDCPDDQGNECPIRLLCTVR